MSQQIPLTQGQFALVDDADYDWLSPFRWYLASSGYAVHFTTVNGQRKSVFMHRLVMNAPRGLHVDHLNQDRLDNRRANLRFATPSQNQAHRHRPSTNTSGYKGVTGAPGHWQVRLWVNKRRLHLGYYANLETAALLYDAAARRFYLDFATVNFPDRPTPPEIEALLEAALEQVETRRRAKREPVPKRRSSYRGVVWERGQWRAKITVDGVRLHLGYFANEADAARAYDEAARRYHGQRARLNFEVVLAA